MKRFISNIIRTSVICSIALIALGLLLIIKSEATIITISYIIGGILIAIGALAEVNYFKEHKYANNVEDLDVVYGIISIILGIIVIKNPEAIASILPLVIGVLIIANSVVKLQYSLELRREENDLWVSTLVLSIIMVICGVLLVFNPFKGAVFLTRIVGIFILVYAILDLVSTFFIKNTLDSIKKTIDEAIDETISDAKVIVEDTTKTEKEEEKEEVKETKKETKKKKRTTKTKKEKKTTPKEEGEE